MNIKTFYLIFSDVCIVRNTDVSFFQIKGKGRKAFRHGHRAPQARPLSQPKIFQKSERSLGIGTEGY
eukprot:snap_masked-scaffold_21-processed-gene-1.21-mRNA-1 protein AED:1.00 eAED:1.00 QI:0/0/0/0/1/1/2/0/66